MTNATEQADRFTLWDQERKLGRFKFYGPSKGFRVIELGHMYAEFDRGWPVGERRQLTGTISAKRIE